ncbi:hypothetical protein KUCAC02_025685, partial [Chaenocephalus aceratus]
EVSDEADKGLWRSQPRDKFTPTCISASASTAHRGADGTGRPCEKQQPGRRGGPRKSYGVIDAAGRSERKKEDTHSTQTWSSPRLTFPGWRTKREECRMGGG